MKKRETEKYVNGKLSQMLNEIAEYERLVSKNTYKYNAYKQAAATLASHPYKIKSGVEARKLKGIGPRIADKIDQFLTTGRIARLEEIRGDENFKAMLTLTKVSGIGPAKAKELIKEGVRTLQDLLKVKKKLNRHQLIGLKYFTDFQLKIPRTEIEGIERVLVEEIAKFDGDYIVTICGSYRRGKSTSGDVDCLITHPGYTTKTSQKTQVIHEISLRRIVNGLRDAGLVIDTIALGQTKFMGVCQLKSKKPARRLDLRLVPHDQYYCSILYFTGSDLFNRNIRAHALANGYTLNEYSLRPLGSTGRPGEPVPLTSERDIFDYINYPYKPPQERNM